MYRFLFSLILIACTLICAGAELPLTAHWDFTKGVIHSVDSARKMRFRGNSQILEENKEKFLRPGMTAGPTPSGIECIQGGKGLSPVGSFRLEACVRFGEVTSNRSSMFLYDTKNVTYKSKDATSNMGVLFLIYRDIKSNSFSLALGGGNGERSFLVTTTRYKWVQGKKYLLSAEYDEKGVVTFSVNGNVQQRKINFTGSLVPGFRRPVIGDRCGSHYVPFEGDIFSVKLFSKPEKKVPAKKVQQKKAPARKAPVVRKKPVLSVSAGFSRAAFFRNEKNAVTLASIHNPFPYKVEVSNISCIVAGQAKQSYHKTMTIPPRKSVTLPVKVNTDLLVGKYKCMVSFQAKANSRIAKHTLSFPVYICPKDFDRFPIYTEAVYDLAVKNILSLGMNERYPGPLAVFLDKDHKNAMRYIPMYMRSFDKALYQGMRYRGLFRLMNNKWSKLFPRKHRDGRTYASTDTSDPKLIALVEKAAALGAKYLDHPAIVDINLNEEMRDMTGPSFNGHQEKAFKKFSGFDIPPNVSGKTSPVNYKTAKDFPADRIISEKDPLYVYYQWFWRGGDGWPTLDGKIASIYKKKFSTPLKARYEPANRMPPIWYLDKEIDIVGNWAYLTPEPITVYGNTSELQAFAARNKHKEMDILGHITLIMYRGSSAPKGRKVANEPSWVKKFPNANYISTSPDLIREALYLQFARKISGLSFHGYNAIYTSSVGWGYICSNHDTKYAMKDFFLNVAQKLGPLSKRLPERPVEVASLHSFASFVYANRASWGHMSWMFNSNLAMLRGNLMGGVIFEDQILRDGFGKIKVLLLPYCDVLPSKVAEKIRNFQAKGGIVVGDHNTTPAIMPDLMITPVERKGDAVADKNALIKAGQTLRNSLKGLYTPYTDSSNADLLTHVRSHKEADYLFVINDKRTFGSYIGQYGLVQEKGLPNGGFVTINRSAGAVYDVIRGREVPFTVSKGVTKIPVRFSTNDGRIFLLLPEKTGSVSAKFPSVLKRGSSADLVAELAGRSGRKITSLHPMQVTVTMPDGKQTDESGYSVFENGSFTRKIAIPGNAPKGVWKITVRELASLKGKTLSFTVK